MSGGNIPDTITSTEAGDRSGAGPYGSAAAYSEPGAATRVISLASADSLGGAVHSDRPAALAFPKLKVLSLFAGIGGFDLGLERTGGFKTVAVAELDAYASRILALRFPDAPNVGDVTTAEYPDADVICAGFPCQDLSYAGAGAGLAGARSGLFWEVVRAARVVRPRYIVLENVAALLGRGLDVVLRALAEIGYDAEWHCIPASAVGAPHRRDRIWIIAHPRGEQHEGDRAPLSGKIAAELSRALADADSQRVRGGGCSEATGTAGSLQSQEQEREWLWSNLGAGGQGCDVADAGCDDAQGIEPGIADPQEWSGQVERSTRPRDASCGGFWATEPDVGGSPDGFPAWLDRYVGRGLSHAESLRASKALRDLWSPYVSQALRRAIGGFDRLQQAEVLFAFLREYEAGSHEARILVAGKEASESFLRSLRHSVEVAGPPCGPGQVEQRAVEHPDTVQDLPRLLALDGSPHWAGGGWEDATPRVARGIPKRVDRLRCLGNAVVPQIPELIGNAILQSLHHTGSHEAESLAAPGSVHNLLHASEIQRG